MLKLSNRLLRFVIVFIVLFTMLQVTHASEIRVLLYEAKEGGSYVPADVTELEKAESLFLRTLQGEDTSVLKDEWQTIDFDLIAIREKGKNYLVLQEIPARKEGRGFYLFRANSNSTSVLQAPHSFKDLRTREITFDLILQSDYAAAAWNTVPRDYIENNVQIDADMAHLEHTFFISFSRAFARHYTQGDLLQLHGYAQDKRSTDAGKASELILSSGTSMPTNTLLETVACMKQKVSSKTYAYPLEVDELGGTTNTIGKALRQLGHEGFMHIEINRGIREQLLTEPKLQNGFNNCLPS